MRRATLAALTLTLAAALIAPAPANALDIPNPLDAVPGIDPAQWVVDGFKAIIEYIIGDNIDQLGRHLVSLLLAVPLFTDTRSFPKLNEYRGYIQGGCWGILGLALVISSLRYWLSGGTGVYDGLIGFLRTAGAIAGLLAFPVAFDTIARATNALTIALVANPLVKDGLSKGMIGTLADTPFAGGGMAMLIGLAALGAALILLVVKIVVTALLAVLFVASPLAIAIWPIEELAWAMRTLLGTMGALLMFPVLWAVCFGAFAVLSPDTLFPGSNGDLINTILSPLITLASLIIAFKLPFAVLHQAQLAGIAPSVNRTGVMVRNITTLTPSRPSAKPPKAPASAARSAAARARPRDPVSGRFLSS